MSRRAWVFGVVLFSILLFLLWWAFVRPLTEPHRLAQTFEEYVERESDLEMRAGVAIWTISSPFSVILPSLLLTEPSSPGRAVLIAGMRLNLQPSSLLSFNPRLEVNSMSFTDLRLLSSTGPQQSDLSSYQGLQGEIRKATNELGEQFWQIEFEGRDLEAQPILSFLGAEFELQARLHVLGTLTATGSDVETLRKTLTGEIGLSGGPGRLDTRGIDSLNRGVVRWARDSGHFVDWPDLMDYQRLEAEFKVLQGLDETRFVFAFENMSLQGVGGMDFFDQTIDYHFELLFDSDEEQDTFQAGEYLADVPWPIRCRGSFEERLPCGLDQDALADLALQLIEQDAKDRLSRTFGEVFQELEEVIRDESP